MIRFLGKGPREKGEERRGEERNKRKQQDAREEERGKVEMLIKLFYYKSTWHNRLEYNHHQVELS